MEQPAPPLERLAFFRRELDITPRELKTLEPYAEALAEHGPVMAEELYKRMGKMAQTKIILEHQTSQNRLQSNWIGWFTMLWKRPCDDSMLATLWHSGLRHVTHGVDHRFITLAYSQVRQYSHRAIADMARPEDSETLHILADKLFDLCVLVESDAYIAAQAHCSNDVMMGIAHQLRNPLTVIGGLASRLLRTNGEGGSLQTSLEAVLGEAGRLERMLEDLVAYIKILRREPDFETISLQKALEEALALLEAKGRLDGPRPELHLDQGHDLVQADASMIREAFYHLLQNAIEAAKDAAGGARTPIVVTSASSSPADRAAAGATNTQGSPAASGHFVTVELCNLGLMPETVDLESLFQPFHSTKPYGTGLGLPIARLAVQKNFGAVQLVKLETEDSECSGRLEDHGGGAGMRCLVTLVKPGHVHDSGLFFSAPESVDGEGG